MRWKASNSRLSIFYKRTQWIDLGVQLNLVGSYKLTKGISFLVGLDNFYTGRFFAKASGSKSNIHYYYIQAQADF